MLPCFSDLVASQASRMPQLRAYTKGLCDSLAGQCPSREKDLENFPKFQVFNVLATHFGDLVASGSSSCEVYLESFAALFTTFSWVDLLVAKNTQTNFSKFCHRGFGDLVWQLVHNLIQSRKSRVLYNEGLFLDNFQKLFSLMHHYHWLYLHFLSSFLLDPLSIHDKKGESILQRIYRSAFVISI